MSANPYESPDTTEQPPERKPSQLKRSVIDCLVVIGVIGILVGLLLPAVRTAGKPARQTMCINNVKVIGLALHNYEVTYGCLPPAFTVDAEGKRLHSWRTLILPFLEQQALYEKIDLSKPWDDPANKEALETQLQAYQCPSVDIYKTHTTYLAIVGSNACFPGSTPRPFSEITDDKGLTLMVVEVGTKQAVPWMSPNDASEGMVLSLGSSDSLPHAGGTQAAFVDGSVRFLSNATKPETLRALISINGDDDAAAREID